VKSRGGLRLVFGESREVGWNRHGSPIPEMLSVPHWDVKEGCLGLAPVGAFCGSKWPGIYCPNSGPKRRNCDIRSAMTWVGNFRPIFPQVHFANACTLVRLAFSPIASRKMTTSWLNVASRSKTASIRSRFGAIVALALQPAPRSDGPSRCNAESGAARARSRKSSRASWKVNVGTVTKSKAAIPS
jgi:hypothetical protein